MVSSVEFSPSKPGASQKISIKAKVADRDGVQSVTAFFRVVGPGFDEGEQEVPMSRVAGDQKEGGYEATFTGAPENRLVRIRLKAVDNAGTHRFYPGENEPKPTLTLSTFATTMMR